MKHVKELIMIVTAEKEKYQKKTLQSWKSGRMSADDKTENVRQHVLNLFISDC